MILVTGATGNVGRQLVDELRLAAVPFRAMSRDRACAAAPARPLRAWVRDHADAFR